jgi:hypothetical protein
MGKLGNCCCPCECLGTVELPSISITGMTGGDWVHTPCCSTKIFTFNTTPTATTTCLPSHSIASFSTMLEADIYATTNVKPPLFSTEQTFPLPLEYCCESGGTFAGTLTASCSGSQEQKLKVTYRPKHIEVRASRQAVNCDGETTCKLVLSTDYVYEYGHLEMAVFGGSSSWEVVAGTENECFEQGDPLLGCEDSVEVLPDEFDCTTPVAMTLTFRFTRVKTYDVWPTGSEVFNNDAIPDEGCSIEICNNEDYQTQVCISATGSTCPYDCAPAEVVEQTWRDDNRCDGLQEQYIFSGCGTPFPTVDFIGDNEPDDRLCPEISRMVLDFVGSEYCEDSDNRFARCGFGSTTSIYFTTASNEFTPGVEPIEGGGYGGCIVGPQPYPEDCQFLSPCGLDGFAQSRFATLFSDVTDYSYTSTCTNTTQSLCVNAPTWTIIFA